MVFSAIVVIGIIVIYFLCQNSESKAVSQEVVQIRTSLSYDRTGKLLILKSRTSNNRNVIKAEASHDINLTSVPDKLVYTGATVGGYRQVVFTFRKAEIMYHSEPKQANTIYHTNMLKRIMENTFLILSPLLN